MKKTCENCGLELTRTDRFCPKFGANIGQRRPSSWIIPILVVAIIAICCSVYFIVYLNTVIPPDEFETKEGSENNSRSKVSVDSGNYVAANDLFRNIDYTDNENKQEMIEESDASIRICSIGDIFLFGSYEQDNNISNGKEDIEWLVLAKEDNSVLAVSLYALDCQQYNTSNEYVTWQTCSLRKWLNDTFISTAFNSEEQNRIINTSHTEDKKLPTDDDSTDKIFILINAEVREYFGDEKNTRLCLGTPYCYAQGACTVNNYIWWWMRAPSRSLNDYAPWVSYDGSIETKGSRVDIDNNAVRPALWISFR